MVVHSVLDQSFELLPEKAMIWKERNMLILADIHFGKITHFRKSGMALPRHAENENYERLSYLILNHPVEKVMILGDLFHSTLNSEWDRFDRFLGKFPEIQFELVMGNHDILDEERYTSSNLKYYRHELNMGPFLFTHIPMDKPREYNICGHVHPAIRMNGSGRQSMRLPCFYFGQLQCILPAFGAFTGNHVIKPGKRDQVYVLTGKRVMQVG